VKLEETLLPAGALRYRMLRKMLRIVTKHGLALETISNWALGIVGLGGGFIIANIDKIDKHVSLCSVHDVFAARSIILLSGGWRAALLCVSVATSKVVASRFAALAVPFPTYE
jgi:hypothetical protein